MDRDAFAQMAMDLHAEPTAARTLDRIADYARTALTAADVGIMVVHSRKRIETPVSSGPRVEQADRWQVEFDEGPCLDAIEDPRVYAIDDLRQEDSYPRWSPAVAGLGFRSVLSLPLHTKARRYGALNLYAAHPKAFDESDCDVGLIFARHASVALAAAHDEEGLSEAMDTRTMIGQAQGILMERFDLDADRAFDFLRRYSQHHNVKLREVAQTVLSNRDQRIPLSAAVKPAQEEP